MSRESFRNYGLRIDQNLGSIPKCNCNHPTWNEGSLWLGKERLQWYVNTYHQNDACSSISPCYLEKVFV